MTRQDIRHGLVACDMPEPRGKFPSLYSGQKGFPRTHKGVNLAPYPVVGLVLQVGDTEKFPKALGFKRLEHKQVLCSTATLEDGGVKRLTLCSGSINHTCDDQSFDPFHFCSLLTLKCWNKEGVASQGLGHKPVSYTHLRAHET